MVYNAEAFPRPTGVGGRVEMLSVCYLAMKIIYHAPSLRIDLIFFFKDLKRRGRRDDGLCL